MTEASSQPPRTAVRLLWLTGIGLDVLAILGLLADAEPEQLAGRILGAAVIAGVGAVSMVAAIMARSRPTVTRRLGLAAAGGMLFVAWLVLTRPESGGFTILVGLALLVIGAIIAWQLYRWPRPMSGEPKDGVDRS